MIQKLISLFSRYPHVRGVNPHPFDNLNCLSKSGKPLATLAMQSVCDRFYFLLFGAIRARLGMKISISTDLIITQSVNGAIGTGYLAEIKRSSPATWLRSRQWINAYGSWINRVGYRCASWAHPVAELKLWLDSWRLWRTLRAQTGSLSLKINGIEVADLVIDSYLRFKPSPAFAVHDPFVRRLIRQALRDEKKARTYFKKIRPNWYLTSHSTYLEHGIPVRVALLHGVSVWSFGNLNGLGKRLSLEDNFHTPDFSTYKFRFSVLHNQEERLLQAQKQLEQRLSGGIDAATSYMRKSAYGNSEVNPPQNLKGAVVVFLHDFYDSPHVYPELVFNDFWDWICFTIKILQQSGLNFFLKPHPNQIALSDIALTKLKAQYTALNWLTSEISNVQLASAKIACGVTVYGTVAHEMAYLGIPTIACARHPHHSFSFCRTARSQDEYAKMLTSPEIFPIPIAEMKRQALTFYYMHNIHGTISERNLAASFVAFWRDCNFGDEPEEAILSKLKALSELPGFNDFISRLIDDAKVEIF